MRVGCIGLLLLVAVAAAAMEEPACLECHDVDPRFAESVHADFECGDCHPGTELEAHMDEPRAASCVDCHEDAVDALATSIHGGAAGAGLVSCESCHGSIHLLQPATDPISPIHPRRLAQTCGDCHADEEFLADRPFALVRPLAAYLSSVHARALVEGKGGADCSSCHGSHDIQQAIEPTSRVNPRRVAETCGECHGEISVAFQKSVHGEALAHGVSDAPSCSDCHGEHGILSPGEPGSPVFATNLPKMTCGRCHGSLRMTERFGLESATVASYADSYHGLAARAGSVGVANCASCHGVHDIRPSSDPESHVYPANLAATCGQCHPGAGTRFAIGAVHVVPDAGEHSLVSWVRWLYLWAIVLVVGTMVVHNGLDLYRKGRQQALRRAGAEPLAARSVAPVERMSVVFRWTHGALAASFIVLVYTGFALTYPEAFWARPLLLWEDEAGLRGGIHRIAAIVLLAAGVFHAGHLVVSRSARACIRRMWLGREDWFELKAKVRFLLGRSGEPPRAPWVGYGEKLEYLAVVWGTVVMAVSGFVLWFENVSLAWAPKWITDLATVVHFYEAVLASLAILVWHFYAVFFDPLVYPMDTAWITGRSAPGRAHERDRPSPASRKKQKRGSVHKTKEQESDDAD